MHFYKAFGLSIHSELELTELCQDHETQTQDLRIVVSNFSIPPLSETHIYRRKIRALFAVDDAGVAYLNWEGVANFKASNGNLLEVDPLTDDPELLSLFTVSEAIGLILYQLNFFLLHASAVKIGNGAWCFTGEPGAGKSTTAAAFIKAGGTLLSDDLTAISFGADGAAFVVPAYPQLKIWDNTVSGLNYNRANLTPVTEGVNKFAYQPKEDFRHEKIRLKQVLFLHKNVSGEPDAPLPPMSVATESLANFPLPLGLLEGQALKEHFEDSFKCAKSAEMWTKERPEDFGKLEEWAREVFEKETQD
ncbi:serine kinase [Dyadobacter sp. CY261]|uniref:serine kinase n=1 Tax=Dyadobacter sp. CY261 TaxID=2907203 RepID=UPI001F1B1FD1|nr:serine kinase [Dyadobacter sp. CY261]MCF0073168.1 serine kinase [Dyadobacter sp. CY261]